jgi:hypothetical protein
MRKGLFDQICLALPSIFPRMVAIKLIGDSFHFHVAYLFQREPENGKISTVFHIKRMFE